MICKNKKGQVMVDVKAKPQSKTLGYSKQYYNKVATGRPNQVFVCNTCNAVRPKLVKMMKHLNVHKKKKQPPVKGRQQLTGSLVTL